MAASSTQYGTTLPSGSDPYQIESVLAKIVGENNPAEAANMLDVYQTQRIADTGNYNYALGQQHDFAKEQLAQQLKETYLKEAMQAVQHRGGTSVYNQLVGPGNAIDPTLTSSIETGLTDLQNSTTAKNVGEASYQGLQGGLATDPGLAGSMTGGFFSGSTMPLSLQREAMVQGGANKRAGAEGGGYGFSVPLPNQPQLGNIAPTLNVSKKGTLAGGLAEAKRQGVVFDAPQALPNTGASAPPPSDTPPARSGTNLQAAPTRAAPPAQSGSDIRQRVEQHVENNVRISNPPAYANIVAGKIGGKVNIVGTAPDGRPIIQGKNGQKYVP